AQQRLWFVQQFDPQNTADNVAAAIRMRGPINAAHLERTLHAIVARHESLRTSFVKNDVGEASQQIHACEHLDLPYFDATDAEIPEDVAKQRIRRLAAQPFDLLTPPLRLELIGLGEDDHVLALATHHIVCDRWSVMIFMRELACGLLALRSADLTRTAVEERLTLDCGRSDEYTPADYAAWQRGQASRLEPQLDYWMGRLAELPAPLELPTTTSNTSAAAKHAGAHCPIWFAPELCASVRRFSDEQKVSLFVVLLAAFKVLLHRYSDTNDIVVGTEVANRERPETAGMIGLLVNTLLLRSDLSGDPSFYELLQRVRDVVLGGLAHQDLPFEKLVESLNPDRDLDQLTPLFHVKFDLQQVPLGDVQVDGLSLERFAVEDNQAKYAVRFNLQETEGQIRGQVEYSADLFSSAAINRMVVHFETLLHGAVTQPDRPISELPLLSELERSKLRELSTGPPTVASRPASLASNSATEDRPLTENVRVWAGDDGQSTALDSLHGMFEAAAAKFPDRVAVIDGDREIAYRELNSLADEIADKIARRDIQEEDCVGISMRKSIEMVASTIGALKAGAAYVPLDPEYPEQRRQFIVRDADLHALVSDEGIDVLGGTDESGRADDRRGESDAAGGRSPLAYVIYTSGSTGQPKGVAIEHASAVAMVRWAEDRFDSNELRGVLASTSICFDLSVFELFVPLAVGGAVVL
ncbi:MAG: condensation domain-containing protein, partial [Planctomycetota bacterium]